jgi:hypothetical protein
MEPGNDRKLAPGLQGWGAYQHYGNPYFRFFYGTAPRHNEAIKSHPAARRRVSKPGGAKQSSQKRKSKKQNRISSKQSRTPPDSINGPGNYR